MLRCEYCGQEWQKGQKCCWACGGMKPDEPERPIEADVQRVYHLMVDYKLNNVAVTTAGTLPDPTPAVRGLWEYFK